MGNGRGEIKAPHNLPLLGCTEKYKARSKSPDFGFEILRITTFVVSKKNFQL